MTIICLPVLSNEIIVNSIISNYIFTNILQQWMCAEHVDKVSWVANNSGTQYIWLTRKCFDEMWFLFLFHSMAPRELLPAILVIGMILEGIIILILSKAYKYSRRLFACITTLVISYCTITYGVDSMMCVIIEIISMNMVVFFILICFVINAIGYTFHIFFWITLMMLFYTIFLFINIFVFVILFTRIGWQ